ncbi:MAG: hypothetical protein HPY50_02710 [Firmicutes bacterium]|nr:hypothetical protein [Bacillota bacterium]
MLPNRNKETILAALRKFDSNKVEIVAIDMWKPYRDAIMQVLPGATVVVDKFNVLRMRRMQWKKYGKPYAIKPQTNNDDS